MNNSNYIINVLLKENNISVKIKNLQANFMTLNKSVNKVSQTVNAVSTNISKSVTNVNTSINKINTTVEKTTNNITNQLNKISLSAFVDIARNLSEAFKSLASSGAGFEQSMANLSSATGITGKELADLSQIARETGKNTGLGAAAAADAFAQLASQIQIDKVGMEGLKTLQKETITLAQASGMSMTDSATAMATTINQFGLEATEANRVINVMAAGSKHGAASISDLAQSFKVTGSVASAAGLSVEQTAGAIEVLSKNNLKGAEAGTALRDILVKMQTTLGMNVGETGLSAALETLKPQMNDATFLAKTFGTENMAVAQYLIANATAVDQMTTAVTNTNIAQEQAAIRTNTSAEQMKRIQATIDDLKIGLFNVTGGFTAYVAAIGDSAVVITQLLPLYNAIKSGLQLIATANIRAAVATTAKSVAEKAAAAVTWTMTAAQTALNAVMKANPIAMIVMAITALTAGVVAAYNNFAGFRQIVDAAWESIKKLASTLWDNLVKAFENVSAVLTPVWSKLKALLGIHEETIQSTEKVTTATNELEEANKSTGNAVDLLTGLLGNQNQALNTNLATIGGIEQKIADLKTKQKEAMTDQAIALEKEIRLWEKKKETMNNAIIVGAATPPELKPLHAPAYTGLGLGGAKNPIIGDDGKPTLPDAEPLKKIVAEIDKAQGKILSFNQSLFGENSVIAGWADSATSGITRITSIFEEFSEMLKNTTLTSVEKVSGSIVAMGALMGAMSGMVDGAAGSWLTWGANILAMVAAAIPQLLTLFGIQCSLAVANSASALPPPFNIIAIAATVAGIAAAIASIPQPKAFANGGIVYGNTFAQVGEYPGAANNPEVIAPLSKLRKLIQPAGAGGGIYEFRLRGRDFIAVANKYNNINERTR